MSWNKYDFIIIFCIAVVAWGGLEILHAFLPIRLIGLYGYFHYFTQSKRRNEGNLKQWRRVYLIWVIYVVISLLWVPSFDFKSSLLQAIHLFLIFGVFLLLQNCTIKANHPIESVILGWATMVTITLPVALWELTTGNHLTSGSANEDLTLTIGMLRAYAAVTFGNLNSYSVVLCYSLPFLLITWMIKVPFQKIIWVISVIVFGIIIMNASRGCVLCAILSIFLFLTINTFRKGSLTKSIGLVIIMGVSIWVAIDYFHLDLFFQLMDRFEAMGMESSREDVYRAGLEIAEGSFFMGTGVASTIPLLTKYHSNLNVLVTHNFYLEVLIEYGIILFVLIFGRFYLSSVNVIRSKYVEQRFYGLYVLFSSPILFLIDDYYSGESAIWIYIFSLMIVETVTVELRKKRC